MRSLVLLVMASSIGCRASATIEQTTPIGNLQTHRTVAIKVSTTAFAAQGRAAYLEAAVTARLREKCGFETIEHAGGQAADLLLDLNITSVGRGGGGFISNSSQAMVDALLVVSDGPSGDLLGASRIRGKSSGMIVNNADPENQALDVMAQTIADVFVKSGCAGARVARAPEPPPRDTTAGTGTGSASTGDPGGGNTGAGSGTGSTGPADDGKVTQAEALNEKGKETLRGGDPQGALAIFQQAAALVPDVRYVFNICLTYQALEQIDQAISECTRARSMNPDERLRAKISQRLEILAGAKK